MILLWYTGWIQHTVALVTERLSKNSTVSIHEYKISTVIVSLSLLFHIQTNRRTVYRLYLRKKLKLKCNDPAPRFCGRCWPPPTAVPPLGTCAGCFRVARKPTRRNPADSRARRPSPADSRARRPSPVAKTRKNRPADSPRRQSRRATALRRSPRPRTSPPAVDKRVRKKNDARATVCKDACCVFNI